MKLYLIRHGQSVCNAEGTVAGSLDTPLTRQGIREAREAGENILSNKLHIDVIACSPFSRSHDTAIILAEKLDYPIRDIVIMKDLSERYCGDFEGKPMEDYQNASEMTATTVYHVESPNDLYLRAKRAFESLNEKYGNKTILLVTHSGIGKMLRIIVEGNDASEFDKNLILPNAELIPLQ